MGSTSHWILSAVGRTRHSPPSDLLFCKWEPFICYVSLRLTVCSDRSPIHLKITGKQPLCYCGFHPVTWRRTCLLYHVSAVWIKACFLLCWRARMHARFRPTALFVYHLDKNLSEIWIDNLRLTYYTYFVSHSLLNSSNANNNFNWSQICWCFIPKNRGPDSLEFHLSAAHLPSACLSTCLSPRGGFSLQRCNAKQSSLITTAALN